MCHLECSMVFDTNVFIYTHYTTANCDAFLEKYLKKGDSVLDIGTGTGVLSLLAKKYGAGRVLAVDISEDAVNCAKENLKDYDVEVRKNYLNFDIGEKFDITVANLDANPAMELLQYAKNTMKEDGVLILTWFDKWECRDIPIKTDFNIIEHTEGQEYNCYVLRR